MRAVFVIAGVAVLLCAAGAHAATPKTADAHRAATPLSGEILDAEGVVFRYYAGHGYRFQPLLSFARPNGLVSARSVGPARRLARALGEATRYITHW